MSPNEPEQHVKQEEPPAAAAAASTTATPPPPSPAFATPLPIRLFLVLAVAVLFKLVYDTSSRSEENQHQIVALQERIDTLQGTINEANRGIDRLQGGFSDMVKGVGQLHTMVGKSAQSVQLIQNDLHDEMANIRKKVHEIATQLNALQQDLRNPFRR